MISHILDVAVLTDEWISENPGWSESEVVEGEGGEHAGVSHSDVDDVVDWLDRVDVSSNGDVESSDVFGAWDIVGVVVGVVSGSESLSESSNNSLWSSEERGSGVGDNLVVLGVSVASELERGSNELPVGGRGQWLIGNNRSAVCSVNGSVGEDTSSNIVGGSLVLKPDGEKVSIEKSLVHGVDEWWDYMVDGEGGEGKSEDSFSGVILEVRRDMGGDSKSGLWHGKLLIGLSSESNSILSQVSLSVSGSVLDGPGLSVLDVGAGFGGVEFGLSFAGAIARWSWNPEVSRSGVQHNQELLSWRSDGDVSEVLKISEVVDVLWDVGVDGWVGVTEGGLVLNVGSPLATSHHLNLWRFTVDELVLDDSC